MSGFIRRGAMTLAALFIGLPAPVAGAQAQEQKKSPVAQAPAIDPAAVATIERMQTFMQTLTTYVIRGDTTIDEVLLSGPKVQFGGTTTATIRLPNRLRLTIERDDKDPQEFFYDGATLVVWIKDRNAWASA